MSSQPGGRTPTPIPPIAPEEIPMTAVALDGRVDLKTVRLPWPEAGRPPYARIYALPDGTRLHLFGFGAVVHEGRAGADPLVLDPVVEVTGRVLLRATEEVTTVLVDPRRSMERPRVGWSRITIQERSTSYLLTVALLLGQSAALERYEKQANAALDEALEMSRYVQRRGRLPWRVASITRRVGRITGDRIELARHFYLEDRPELTWEDASVSTLYDALYDNLELAARHEALRHKLEAVSSTVETLVGLWQGRLANGLEWAIVLLIVLEVVMALAGLA